MKLPNIAYDKALHLIAGLLVFTIVLPYSADMALVAAVAAGAGKEAYDRVAGPGTSEFMDFAATFAGGLWGYMIVLLATRF